MDWSRIEEIFFQALAQPPIERALFVAQQAAGDESVAREVLAMLAADDGQPASIEARLLDLSESVAQGHGDSKSGDPIDDPIDDPRLGRALGPYRLIRLLGEGGMGRVYLAQRRDGSYSQNVAVKILRAFRRTAGLVERFQVEREILARLQHPNVATLLDGGMTAEGLPYLVMQYIEGTSLIEHCDAGRRTLEERLRLFLTVCEAVEFAQAHLIVHRDLKPSNILVTAEGDVKLLDFGVAKLLDPESFGLAGLETQTTNRALTPLYSAPEQLLETPVTTATDVYSLGVLLFELLCGRLPYELTSSRPSQVEAAICHEPPLRPRQALESGGKDHQIAARLGTDPTQLKRLLQGDLESILLKALRKEPGRRYPSARELGDDIRRYLQRRPVLAHPDSMTYRLSRFVGRHKAPVAAALLVSLALLASGVQTWLHSQRLEDERRRANLEQIKAERVVETLVDLLNKSSPEVAQGSMLNLDEFLLRAADSAEQMSDQPGLRARLLQILGTIYLDRGEPGQALPLLQRAWATEQSRTPSEAEADALIFHAYAKGIRAAGDLEAGRAALSKAVYLLAKRYGPRHRFTVNAMAELALALDSVAGARLLEEVASLQREILPPKHDELASTLNNLATFLIRLNRNEEAAQYLREALDIMQEQLGPDHPATLSMLENLQATIEDPAERQALMLEVLERRTRVFGPDSGPVAQSRINFGVQLALRGDIEGALEHFSAGHEILSRVLGERHWRTGNAARNTARAYQLLGDYSRSLDYFDQALEATREELHLSSILGQAALVRARVGLEARSKIRQAIEIAESESDTGSTLQHRLRNRLIFGQILLAEGDPKQAQEQFELVLSLLEDRGSPSGLDLAEARLGLGRALAAQGLAEPARTLLESALPSYRRFGLADPVEIAAAEAALRKLSV